MFEDKGNAPGANPVGGIRMFSIGPNQILLILLIVLLIFGAKKLPEIGGGLGRAIRNFRRASSEPDEIDITAQEKKTPAGHDDTHKA